jgi:phospholipase/carboxylesterase
VTGASPVGLQPLMLGAARDSYLYVPVGYQTERSAPLVLRLHGAGGHARQGLELLRNLADATGIILLAPASRERKWDLLVDRRYGSDVTMIERALEQTFSRYAIDPPHLAIGGFSDGASYALSLGITNGDLFTHTCSPSHPGSWLWPGGGVVHAFSSPTARATGCCRSASAAARIVPALRSTDYDVHYREFDGGHTIPPTIALEAVRWFTQHNLP